MRMSAPACLLSTVTDPFTGRPIFAKICSWCEKERHETPVLKCYLVLVGGEKATLSHGICPRHYLQEMEKLKIA